MSQYPPSYQPPGYPPNSGFGGPPQYPQQPGFGPPPRTSGLAIASLIFAVLGCVPVLFSLIAVFLGIGGISATGKPNVRGRGLAIAGLIIGLLGVAGWLSVGGVMWAGYNATKPGRAIAHQFLYDLSTGNLKAAQDACDTTVTSDDLQKEIDRIKSLGTLRDTTFLSFSGNTQAGGGTEVAVAGKADFANGSKSIAIQMVKRGDSYKITHWQLSN